MVLRCEKGAAEGWGAMPHGRAAKQPLRGPGFDPSTKKKKILTKEKRGEMKGISCLIIVFMSYLSLHQRNRAPTVLYIEGNLSYENTIPAFK